MAALTGAVKNPAPGIAEAHAAGRLVLAAHSRAELNVPPMTSRAGPTGRGAPTPRRPAYEPVLASDVRDRFVIDTATLR